MDPLETKSGDDALQERTHIRHDLPGLLQVRPKMLKPSPSFPPPSYPRGEVSKGRGKGEQDKKQWENKGKVQWVSEIKTKDGGWKPLCMWYHPVSDGEMHPEQLQFCSCLCVPGRWRVGLWTGPWSQDASSHSRLTDSLSGIRGYSAATT